MEHDVEDQISKVQEELRHESSVNNKLRTQYQKLYEIICSTASRNIHETFNETLRVWIITLEAYFIQKIQDKYIFFFLK